MWRSSPIVRWVRNFNETRWSPDGSRPHLVVPVSAAVADLAAAYVAHARAWWSQQLSDGNDSRSFEEVFTVTERPFLHLTLSWLDRPTHTLPAVKLAELGEATQARMRELDPFTVSVGPGVVGYYALELYVTPDAALDALAAAARASIRDVFGSDAVADPPSGQPWVPHVAVFYGAARTDTDGLASRVLYRPPPGHTDLARPVPMTIAHVLVEEQNTWGTEGLTWNVATARQVPLGNSPSRTR